MVTIRLIAAALLGIVAAFFLLISLTTPFLLREDVEENRSIKAAFDRTAAYASAYAKREGRLPDEATLDRWTEAQRFGWYSTRISLDPVGCGQEGFVKQDGDFFVLGLWRGEWFECSAYPSGRTTLKTSRVAFLGGGMGLNIAVWFLLGCLSAWLAWRLVRRAYLLDKSRRIGTLSRH
jgi:hypothetical protein